MDDHDVLAQSLAIALRVEGVVATVAPLQSAEAVVDLAEAEQVDLVLLDLDLGGAIGDGSALVPSLVGTGSRVLVLTGSTEPYASSRALELGAIGVVRKDQPFRQLVATVLDGARGHAAMDADERRSTIQAGRQARRRQAEALEPFKQLSAREAEVLHAIADGRSVAEIASSWFVAEATVRTQVRGVLTKLGVTSQLAAVAAARRAGWLRTWEHD